MTSGPRDSLFVFQTKIAYNKQIHGSLAGKGGAIRGCVWLEPN